MVETVVEARAAVYGDGRGSGACAGDGVDQFGWGRKHTADSNKARRPDG